MDFTTNPLHPAHPASPLNPLNYDEPVRRASESAEPSGAVILVVAALLIGWTVLVDRLVEWHFRRGRREQEQRQERPGPRMVEE